MYKFGIRCSIKLYKFKRGDEHRFFFSPPSLAWGWKRCLSDWCHTIRYRTIRDTEQLSAVPSLCGHLLAFINHIRQLIIWTNKIKKKESTSAIFAVVIHRWYGLEDEGNCNFRADTHTIKINQTNHVIVKDVFHFARWHWINCVVEKRKLKRCFDAAVAIADSIFVCSWYRNTMIIDWRMNISEGMKRNAMGKVTRSAVKRKQLIKWNYTKFDEGDDQKQPLSRDIP